MAGRARRSVLGVLALVHASEAFVWSTRLPDELLFDGRWQITASEATADWPCVSVRFAFNVTGSSSSVSFSWSAIRARANVTVERDSGALFDSGILLGSCGDILNPFCAPKLQIWTSAALPPGQYTLRIIKLSSASPYGLGAGSIVPGGPAAPLTLHAVGLGAGIELIPLRAAPRKITVIGASDTQGYCVDGTPHADDHILDGWMYDNCAYSYGHQLAASFGARLSVQAEAGFGLTQNHPFAGWRPLPFYWDRTRMNEKEPRWEFGKDSTELILISLGGNDYNGHGGDVPSEATFVQGYHEFLDRLQLEFSGRDLTVVNICGMGDPTEARIDPDNVRCRPCPFVEQALLTYSRKTPYIFIPCNGSVVTGIDDIGCNHHKNRLGQARVAEFLRPKLADIMGW